MSAWRRTVGIALAVLAVGAGLARAGGAAAQPPERRILVMIALPTDHYRPGVDYSGGYDPGHAHAATRRTAEALARAYGLTVAQDWPMVDLGVSCYVMAVAPQDRIDEKLGQLARDSRVESAQSMNTFQTLSHDDPLYGLQPAARLWHLDRLHERTTGRGVRIALVDSGAQADHPDLADRIEIAENFVDGQAYVAELHGTAVAGVIAAVADNGIGIVGVAPDARLLALRACWQDGAQRAACDSFSLAKAVQFALSHHVDLINLSLSGPPDRLLQRLIARAVDRGVAVVAAADPDQADGGYPASDPNVIAVAEQEAPASVRAAVPFSAPGRDVPTAEPLSRWGFVDGSSFAAAHVSGLLALARQLQPSLAPVRLRAALCAGAPAAPPCAPLAPVDACAVIARLAPTWRGCDSTTAAARPAADASTGRASTAR